MVQGAAWSGGWQRHPSFGRRYLYQFQPWPVRPLITFTIRKTTAIVAPVMRAKLRQGCGGLGRSEEHTSELQSLMRISYAVFCLKKKNYKLKSSTLYNQQLIHQDLKV